MPQTKTVESSVVPAPAPAVEPSSLSALVRAPAYQARFAQVLGERGPQFLSSLLSVGNSMPDVDPKSIIASGMVAAALDLPVDKSLGMAWIVPYKQNVKQRDGSWITFKRAQMQIGYKGYIQLGLRSAQYSRLNAIPINKEVFAGYDQVGEPVLDFNKLDPSAAVWGYFFGFVLVNGFVKRAVWTKEQVEKHASKFSQSYRMNSEIWKDNFDEMALKTVIANTLRKWGPLSIQMQMAVKYDQAVVPELDAEPIAAELEDAMDRPAVHPEIAKQEKIGKMTLTDITPEKKAPVAKAKPEPKAPVLPTVPATGDAITQAEIDAAEAEYAPVVQAAAPTAAHVQAGLAPAPEPAKPEPAPAEDIKALAAKTKAALERANQKMKDAAQDQADEAMGKKERKPLVQEMEPVATQPENVVAMPEPEPEPEPIVYSAAQKELGDQLESSGITFEEFVDWGRSTIQMKVDTTRRWAGFSDQNCLFFISKIAHIVSAVKAYGEKKGKKK